jgi:hypothetical protein
MCASSRKLRHPFVIELGSTFLGLVTLAAILAEFTPMSVVFLVAVVTGALTELVVSADVTRDTSNGLMLAF